MQTVKIVFSSAPTICSVRALDYWLMSFIVADLKMEVDVDLRNISSQPQL